MSGDEDINPHGHLCMVRPAANRRRCCNLQELELRYDAWRDGGLFAFCAVVGGLIFGILAMSAWASFVTRWPYNLTLPFESNSLKA